MLFVVSSIRSKSFNGNHAISTTGIVVIGRNEGERLRRCLESVRAWKGPIVYVDSGSTDGSVALSLSFGVLVEELDPTLPFTAARARNSGFRRIEASDQPPSYVFFVDGDCQVLPNWLEKSRQFLDENPTVAVVWGRRKERFPRQSIYNMLCDIEWQDWPVGEVKACGGDAVMRADAFRQVDGYRSELICGEEPELCVRLRQLGWKIYHLDDEMTVHDAAIYRFSQWWKRSLRAGYGFAQGAHLHGSSPYRHWVWESSRSWIWVFGVPLASLLVGIGLGTRPAMLMLMIYPLQFVRLGFMGRRTARENWWRAGAMIVGKFPEILGQLKFYLDQYRRTRSELIEYK